MRKLTVFLFLIKIREHSHVETSHANCLSRVCRSAHRSEDRDRSSARWGHAEMAGVSVRLFVLYLVPFKSISHMLGVHSACKSLISMYDMNYKELNKAT